MITRLSTRLLEQSRKSILLLGPRQTGKSTLIRSLNPDLEINLARESTYLEFISQVDALESHLKANPKARTVFIDEIQRIPSLLNTIQAEIDAPEKGKIPKFFLTGSSARKLRRGHANLLPGRIGIYYLGPLAAAELHYEVETKRALSVGTLPDPYFLESQEEAKKLLRDYASTYLKEEIQAEALSRNLAGFARFLQAVAITSGQFLDFSKLSRKAKISRQSAVRYFEVLEDTLLAYRIESVDSEKFPDADLVQHPRYFLFDVGVLNGILENFNVSEDRIGNLFEHLLLSQWFSSAHAKDIPTKVWNFRTRGGLEIDFICELNAKTYLIEAKACKTSDVRGDDIVPLLRVQKHDDRALPYVACLEGPNRNVNGVPVMSWQSLLSDVGL